jgi:trk system potassium uptake protein TrkH
MRQQDEQIPLHDSGPSAPAQRASSELARWLPWFALGYVVLAWLGFAWLRHPGVMSHGQEINSDRAIFLATNAATLTGFQQAVGVTEFNVESIQGPLIILTLTLAGTLLALIVGGLAAVRALRLPYSDRQVVIAAITAELIAVLAGTAGLIGPDRPLLQSLQMAVAAFGNCGTILGKLPGLFDWRTHVLLLPLAVLGGLGLPVLMELYDAMFGVRPLSRHSRVVLAWTGGSYVCAFAILLTMLWPRPKQDLDPSMMPLPTQQHFGWTEVRQSIAQSSILSLESRTAGFHFDLIKTAPRAAQWIVVVLMFIGASPAGAGGGLKTTTVHTLLSGSREVLTGRAVNRVFGIALVWLGIYASVVLVGYLLLLITQPQLPADWLLFMTFSAVSNVGLSHDVISSVGPGLYVLSILMLVGRVTPLLILCWLARVARSEADVLVG